MALRRFFCSIVGGVRDWLALMSRKANPVIDKDDVFSVRLCGITSVLGALGVTLSLYLLAFESHSWWDYARHCFTLGLNCFVMYINGKRVTEVKKKARMRTVLDLVDVALDEYEVMVLKLAAARPGLPPPSRKEYDLVRKRAEADEAVQQMMAVFAGFANVPLPSSQLSPKQTP